MFSYWISCTPGKLDGLPEAECRDILFREVLQRLIAVDTTSCCALCHTLITSFVPIASINPSLRRRIIFKVAVEGIFVWIDGFNAVCTDWDNVQFNDDVAATDEYCVRLKGGKWWESSCN